VERQKETAVGKGSGGLTESSPPQAAGLNTCGKAGFPSASARRDIMLAS
jgi:hypothetical protein